jgi:uncharacterized protein YbjQ (UPF0145 family)
VQSTGLILQLGFAVLLLLIGLFIGSWNERRHYRSIRQRESAFRGTPVSNLRGLPETGAILSSRLVCGSVVISIDAFKQALAGLQSFFGGEVTAYETLIDRARREAMLRLYDQIGPPEMLANVRIETSAIGNGDKVSSVEVLAYATAVELRS